MERQGQRAAGNALPAGRRRLVAGGVRRRDAGGSERAGRDGYRHALGRAHAATWNAPGREAAGPDGGLGMRENGVGASRVPEEEEAWPSWEDAAVPPERARRLSARFRQARSSGIGYEIHAVRPFRRWLHSRPHHIRPEDRGGRRRTSGSTWTRRPISDRHYGGSLSGEHGDGQAKARVAAEHVRRRADPGVPRIQGDLGPALADESRAS